MQSHIESSLAGKLLPFLLHTIWVLIAINSSVGAQSIGEYELEKIDQFVYSGPMFIKGMHSLAEFRSLGTVLHERNDERINSFDEKQKDRFVLLVFDGLEIYGRVNEGKSNFFLPIWIKITKSKWNISGGLSVGVDAEIVKNKLGFTKKHSVRSLEYCGETECVNFGIKGGKVSSVKFSYYAD